MKDHVDRKRHHLGLPGDVGDQGQTTLSTLVKEMKENPKLTVDLQGYADPVGTYGYNVALMMTQVLKQCGNELSRENILKQARNIRGLSLPTLIPST